MGLSRCQNGSRRHSFGSMGRRLCLCIQSEEEDTLTTWRWVGNSNISEQRLMSILIVKICHVQFVFIWLPYWDGPNPFSMESIKIDRHAICSSSPDQWAVSV